MEPDDVPRHRPPTPQTEGQDSRGGPRLPLAQTPHAANTWSPLQCGARAPEGRTRARGAGRPLQVCQTAGPGGVNSALPSRPELTSDHSPRPSRFLEPSACLGARPNGKGGGKGKGGEGRGKRSGGHAPGPGGATRKARGRRSSHHPADEDDPRGPHHRPAATSRTLALPSAPPHASLQAVPSPGWPSPTDSEVKRNVPSSMNASWKPLSCPFMLVSVCGSGLTKEQRRGGSGCEMRKLRTASYS